MGLDERQQKRGKAGGHQFSEQDIQRQNRKGRACPRPLASTRHLRLGDISRMDQQVAALPLR